MRVEKNGTSFDVSFEYDPVIIDRIKKAPDGRRYIKSSRCWRLPITIDNINFLLMNFDISAENKNMLLIELDGISKSPFSGAEISCFKWGNIKPFKHQKNGLSAILSNNFVALFWEQGCGKTLPVIKAIEYYQKKSLIVCPKTVTVSWAEQFETFSDVQPVIITGPAKKRKKMLLDKSNTFIINYDLLKTMELDLISIRFDIIVFDESQYIKTPGSQRSKAAFRIAKNIKKRILLTGTPITRSAEDIFSQFKILDPSIFGISFYAFRNKYFHNVGWGNIPDWQIRPGALEEIKQKISLRAQRLKKEDVLDLPDKLFQKLIIEMTPEQKRIYKEIERDLVTTIDENEIVINFLVTKMMKLNQVASGFIINENEIIEISNKKTKETRQIFEDSDRPKIVIWALFKHDIKAISAEFSDIKHEIIDGSKTTDERMTAIDNFQNGDSKIIIIQEQAGATGITLTASNLVIFYSHSYNLGNRLQAEDRSHRIGQNKNVTYIDLIADGSIENDILENINKKRLLSGYIQGDITRELFIELKNRGKK